MNIVFWITKQCNLNCSYCYVKKENQRMTLDIANAAVKFAIDKINNSKDNRIMLSLHGGEPFLNLNIAKYIIENIKSSIDKDKELLVTLTTNGTLINEEIIHFIKEHINYSFSVSLDGVRDIHNKNRIYKNGNGSFDDVINNLKKLKEEGVYPRIRITNTPETVESLYDTYVYFHTLGYRSIATVLDFTDIAWNEESLTVYNDNLNKIMNFLKENDFDNFKLKLRNIKKATFTKQNVCGAGNSSINIDYNGDIYPCSYSLDNKKNAIGNIYTGIQKMSLKKIKFINNSEITKCIECKYKMFCKGNRCKYVNLKVSGDTNKPSNLHCYLNIINHNLLLENMEYL